MDQFIQFVMQHWWLWAALAVVVVIIGAEELRGKMTRIKQVTPQEATMMMNRENAVIVDIRKQDDFNQGHIVGAVNVPFSEFEDKFKSLKKYVSKPVILCCYKGVSALKAAETLKKQAFAHVFSLEGGMGGWLQAGYPIEK